MAVHGRGAGGEAQINNQRRILLLQAFEMDRAEEKGLSTSLRGQLRTMPGTPLPLSTPARAKFTAPAVAYLAIEDFDGASVDELVMNVPALTRAEAAAALAALGF